MTAPAQFRRGSDSNAYPYTVNLNSNDVFIVGRPGTTNYNIAQSNLLSGLGGITSSTASNIATAAAATGLLTNQFTTNTIFQTVQTAGSTNFTVTIGTIYQKVIATNDVAFTNVSGVGCASVRVLPGGADRFIYFPTNWAFLDTNNFTLAGSQWRTGLTNGNSRIGWLSVVADGTSATNVAALWRATP